MIIRAVRLIEKVNLSDDSTGGKRAIWQARKEPGGINLKVPPGHFERFSLVELNRDDDRPLSWWLSSAA